MDPDPDLRADAMAALARCARPGDAPAIRRSLAGDPVGEVKVAAVQALARLKDGGAGPLLRALALGRCEAEVAWEEPGSGWDDWLDVQVAAIEALGTIGAEDAVDDLIEARDDEMGQDLDHVVFAALARMTELAVVALKDGDPTLRAAAARALAARSDAASHLAPLLDDPDDSVRATALKAVAAADSEQAVRGFGDPSAIVRGAALDAAAGCGQDRLVEQALRALVEGGFTDTLHQACRRHPIARQALLAMLREADSLSPQRLLMILQALTHAAAVDAGGAADRDAAAREVV